MVSNIYLLQDKRTFKTFADGNLLRNMEISGSYIPITLYMDEFNANCAIGSSSSKHKILGIYCTPFDDIKVASKRSTIQTIALIFNSDVVKFGLVFCLIRIITDLKMLVQNGIYDKKLNKTHQVRIICSLGNFLKTFLHYHYVLRALKTSLSCSRCQTYVFKTKIL